MRAIALSLAAALSTAALAEGAFAERPGGAEVHFASITTEVEVGGVTHELDSQRVALDFAEAANDWLYVGVAVGLAFEQLSTVALVDDADPSGYTGGVFVGARFFELGPFALEAEARHQRVYAEGSGTAQDATLRYGETSARLTALFRWRKLELAAGGHTLRVDGEAEATGALAGAVEFTEVERSGVHGALRLAIDGGYALGVRVESGARDGFALTFSTRF